MILRLLPIEPDHHRFAAGKFSKIITMLLLVITAITNSFCGEYDLHNSAYFFGRQPSARSEAMGHSSLLISGDAFASFYNPAGTAFTKDLNIGYAHSNPYYLITKGEYDYWGFTYKINNWSAFSLRIDRFDYGYKAFDYNFKEYTPNFQNYSFNYALQKSGYALGINFSYYYYQIYAADNPFCFPLDLGMAKIFQLTTGKNFKQSLSFETCLRNVFGAKIKINHGSSMNPVSEGYLPQILRIGTSYFAKTSPQSGLYNLDFLALLLHLEYQDILNYDYYTGYSAGCEWSLFEVFAVRIGTFSFSINNASSPNSKAKLSEFTYGFGIAFPLQKISPSVPFTLSLDWINLKQPTYIKNFDKWDSFTTYSLNIKWHFRGAIHD